LLALVCACGGADTGSATQEGGAPRAVDVQVEPRSAQVEPNRAVSFAATVTGTANGAVRWDVVEQGGGAITAAGVYTAPAVAGTYRVRATSVVDATKAAVATVAVTPAPAPGASPMVAGCPIFPADNPWNTDISAAPLDARSSAWVASIGSGGAFHPDFGSQYGIPYTTADASTPKVPVTFDYADESDPGPYPIPRDAPIEAGGDAHVLVVDTSTCKLYELFAAQPATTSWHAGAGAVFDLRSNALRPAGWTSADAAGLPVLAGLARYDEAAAGEIRHALRFTAVRTQRGYVHPARHFASSITDPNVPPMGARARLKASVDVSRFPPQARAVARALQRYGMILADNGSNWYVTGALDPRWTDSDLGALKSLRGSDFEFVQAGPVTTR
jgi:hypothetical protein